MKDIEVISHLVGSMQEASKKLENAVKKNDLSETTKLKSAIFDLSRKIHEEVS